MITIVKDEEESSATLVPQFDPSKKYKWTPDTKFVMNGGEFASLLNSLRAILGTEQAQTIIMAQQASEALEGLLKGAVEDGRAVEIE